MCVLPATACAAVCTPDHSRSQVHGTRTTRAVVGDSAMRETTALMVGPALPRTRASNGLCVRTRWAAGVKAGHLQLLRARRHCRTVVQPGAALPCPQIRTPDCSTCTRPWRAWRAVVLGVRTAHGGYTWRRQRAAGCRLLPWRTCSRKTPPRPPAGRPSWRGWPARARAWRRWTCRPARCVSALAALVHACMQPWSSAAEPGKAAPRSSHRMQRHAPHARPTPCRVNYVPTGGWEHGGQRAVCC